MKINTVIVCIAMSYCCVGSKASVMPLQLHVLLITDGEYRAKYEKTVREFNFQIKKKTQEHEDEIEELKAEKKVVDRKV